MKMRLTLILVVMLVLITSCGKSEESSTDSQIVYANSGSSNNPTRYSQFTKFPVVTTEPDPDGISFESIGFAADGAYLMVQFKAPINQSQLWQQDYIYVVDEATRGVYKDIPIMPVVGPLIGRPVREGQSGYVMLANYYQGIKNGSIVTVVLGNYKREHVKVDVPTTSGAVK